jgi:CheY-like chemotaxis protein
MSTPESIDMPENVGRLKVLAVDDDSLILMNTAALLEDLGHVVLEATSGAEALELIRDHGDINLLITDQAMPNMTGTQLVQQVAGLRPDLPIILATGYGEVPPGFETSVIKLGKPFGQNQLEQAVAQALGRNG